MDFWTSPYSKKFYLHIIGFCMGSNSFLNIYCKTTSTTSILFKKILVWQNLADANSGVLKIFSGIFSHLRCRTREGRYNKTGDYFKHSVICQISSFLVSQLTLIALYSTAAKNGLINFQKWNVLDAPNSTKGAVSCPGTWAKKASCRDTEGGFPHRFILQVRLSFCKHCMHFVWATCIWREFIDFLLYSEIPFILRLILSCVIIVKTKNTKLRNAFFCKRQQVVINNVFKGAKAQIKCCVKERCSRRLAWSY
jgi:hypothetical protein